jgi:hypothetical protein
MVPTVVPTTMVPTTRIPTIKPSKKKI